MITPLYAVVLAALFVALSVRALRIRRAAQVPVGDGGDARLLRAMRAHANFAEYTPIALLLVYFCELLHGSTAFIHLLGSCLLAGRAIHAFGVSHVHENYRYRVVGMVLTFFSLGLSGLAIVYAYL